MLITLLSILLILYVYFSIWYVQAESDENDNDVIFSSVDCENPTVSAVDAVEIHVVDENGLEINKDETETKNNDAQEDIEKSIEYNTNTFETEFSDCNTVIQMENETFKKRKSHDVRTDYLNEDKTLKNKLPVRKSKSKEMKKPMQIFTVLEEEISDVSDIETPRTW